MHVLLTGLMSLVTACGQISTNIKVVDEEGNPIEGAKVTVGFLAYLAAKDVYESKDTDAEGIAKITGNPEASLRFEVTKENYYKSEYKDLNHTKNHDIEVVLRKKINPIPLFAKKESIQIPLLNKAIGYDFEVGDWVKPHGSGQYVDLYFKIEKDVKSYNDYKCETFITFARKQDGLAEDIGWMKFSEFKSTREAQEQEYLSKEKIIDQKDPVKGYDGNTPDNNYLLRIRTVLDKKGDIITSHYAKITGGVKVAVGTNESLRQTPPRIRFTYYFNPIPNDRNLEFDTENNLFQDLKREERVTEP